MAKTFLTKDERYLFAEGSWQQAYTRFGAHKAVVNGKHTLLRMEINPEAVDPDDVEMLQDLVVAAVNEAMRKAEAEANANMSKLTGGLNLGGLF